ncbi:MAG: YheC/YheD family protein [Alicyclobacillus sp.]|nr:YheC/YheD family protein [Alicyclobacillus sp.]
MSRLQSLPRLGVYVHPAASPRSPFGQQTQLLIDLTRLGQRLGVEVGVLTPGYLQSRQGWIYTEVGWELRRLPLPDVVLRRSGAFPGIAPGVVAADLRFFRQRRCLHTLPRKCGNKGYVSRWLQRESGLRPYVPMAQVAAGAAEVYDCVHALRDVYVKPLTGSRGAAVFRLIREGGGLRARWHGSPRGPVLLPLGHRKSYQPADSSVQERWLRNLDEFARFFAHTGLQRCLVQATVPLPETADGHPFDLRWLVQFTDAPQVVARVARIGAPGAVTTNIHVGASAQPAEQALQEAGFAQPMTSEQIDQVALTLAERLRAEHGPYAELGVDFAVTPSGQPMILEINPTPGRRMLKSLGTEVRERSLACLLEYAIKATQAY